MLQLNPPLPVHIVGKGSALAHGWIDYGPEHHLIWVCAFNDDGTVWCFANPLVRLPWNVTMDRVPSTNSGVVDAEPPQAGKP